MIARIYHTWDKWECYPAGFYANRAPKGFDNEQCKDAYRDFLADLARFEKGLVGVLRDWPNSCEHYLTNVNMNRIAWLGQAAMCHETGIPAIFRGGYNRLSPEQQQAADDLALKYLNIWLASRGEETLTHETARSRTEANLY